MDESKWLTAREPLTLLLALSNEADLPGPDWSAMAAYRERRDLSRALRLFAVACCRAAFRGASWRAERTLLAATAFADEASEENREAMRADRNGGTEVIARYCCLADAREAAWEVARATAGAHGEGVSGEEAAAVVREVMGNPFRWEEWRMPDHLQVRSDMYGWAYGTARHAYETGEWDGLGAVGDVLEELGCPDGDLLRHLRGQERCPACRGGLLVEKRVHVPDPPYMRRMVPKYEVQQTCCVACEDGWVKLRGPHQRGCWAVDAVMGKR